MPKQARSRASYEAVLDGAIRVFDQEGQENATTTRIAEVAGVSVGTLYQYFESRDAIVDALQDREFRRAEEMLTGLLRSTFSSERELARAVVSGLLSLYRAAPGLHRILAIEGLRIAPTEHVQAYDHRIVETLRSFFAITGFRIGRTNHHAAAFVLYHSVRATLLAAIMEDTLALSDQILTDEVSELIVSYLLAAKNEEGGQ